MTTHPRLTVVPVGVEDRAEMVAALRGRAHVVDRGELAACSREAFDRRMAHDEAILADLEERLAALESSRAAAERVLADLTDEQHRTRRAADWCEEQPELDEDDTGRLASAAEELEEHSSAVRDANRRLERVLEQRAAAEAAIEDAREHLESLKAAGFDETGVRRQIEAASRELRDASADYQEQMKEVARRQATVARLEEALNVEVSAEPGENRDQLQSMRAAIDAKLAAIDSATTGPEPTAEELDEARDALQACQSAAEAAMERLGGARQRVSALEDELTVRSDGETSQEARYEAALELEAQVTSVESRLGEAEVEARAEVEEVTREMTRAELSLDHLRQRIRERGRDLATYARLVPEDERTEVESDPLLHVAEIARALRTHADEMQPDRDDALATLERERTAHEATLGELERCRAGLGVVTTADRVEALRSIGADAAGPLVLDGIVRGEDGGGEGELSTSDLDVVEPPSPLIVLTDDPDVIGWGIELSADRGVVVSPAAIRPPATDRPTALAVPDTAAGHHSNR
ncbi:MAG: hypothetical protein U5K30_09205 [Acidimicrobiales bacterium]|nr:hypothetical protein [Acidimicrobiales bacterium]